MRRTTRIATVLLGAVLIAAASPLPGVFALQQGAPRSHAFLRATPREGAPLRLHLDAWLTDDATSAPIRSWRRDMTKLLHLIIVRDDFTTFEHVHPVLGTDGHFTIDRRFPAAGRYHVYVDGTPEHLGQQVFRFELAVGTAPERATVLPRATRIASAGAYRVEIDKTTVRAGREDKLSVHIRKGGRPARDLHPYLGTPAHAVLISTRSLGYVHAHPAPLDAGGGTSMGDMHMENGSDETPLPDNATSTPDMQFHIALRDRGAYVLWLQFRGGDALYVVPFSLTAQ